MRSPRSKDQGQATESGSGLVTVLVMTAVVTTLIGIVLALFVTQHRFIQRDVQRTEALYLAEAAVYQALARLHTDPDWQPAGDSLAPTPFPAPRWDEEQARDGKHDEVGKRILRGGSTAGRLPLLSVR